MIFLSTMVVNCFSEALKRNVTFHAVLPVDKRSFDGAGPRDDRPMKTLYLLHGVYEDGSKYTRKHGKEERGVLKESSLNRLSHAMDRYLENTKDLSCVPTQRMLLPESVPKRPETAVDASPVQTAYVDKYLMLLEAREREKALEKLVPDERVEQMLFGLGEEDVRGV